MSVCPQASQESKSHENDNKPNNVSQSADLVITTTNKRRTEITITYSSNCQQWTNIVIYTKRI